MRRDEALAADLALGPWMKEGTPSHLEEFSDDLRGPIEFDEEKPRLSTVAELKAWAAKANRVIGRKL